MKFKVLRGRHTEGGVMYQAGEVVDSSSDLNKHNSPGSRKFEQLSGEVADAPSASLPESSEDDEDPEEGSDELDGMTVAQLKTFAAEEEIDLSGVSRKSDILSAIRATLQGG